MRGDVERVKVFVSALFIFLVSSWAFAEAPKVYPTAIFPFTESGSNVKEYGEKSTGILFAKLAEHPEIVMVERSDIDKILQEIGLGLSGVIPPEQASKVGTLTGAKILVTGSVFEVEGNLHVVAKIIGTETSRVMGKSAVGKPEDFAKIVEKLSVDVGDVITKDGKNLVAAEEKPEDRVAVLNKKLGEAKRPVVLVKISERHTGQPTIDPSAQTELVFFCKETGFEVINPDKGDSKEAEIVIEGEGLSEFALRKGDLVSVKARLEVKAVERTTNKVIAVERQTVVIVDLSEQIAGKKALQEAAASIAERLLPKIVKK